MSKSTLRIDSHGIKYWELNGVYHREDGPAIEYTTGTKSWWINGRLHREDGPAIELISGTKEWYQNGVLHRVDGPALERGNGNKYWFLDNKQYSQTEWFQQLTLEQQENYLWNLNE